MYNFLKFLIFAVIFVLIVIAGVSWEIFRWHTFQDITHSDIGFWKWLFLFSGK